MKNKILIILPCYNVGKTLEKTFNRIQFDTIKNISEIIAIDNKSSDSSLKKLLKIKSQNKIVSKKLKIIKNHKNYGLGGSLKVGFLYALENNFTHIIIIHSDEQGDVNQIIKNFMVQFEKNADIDLIMASRFIKNSKLFGYSKLRILGNYFFNIITFLFTGARLTDSGCGIIMLNTKSLSRINFLELSDSFYFNPQLNVYLTKLKNFRKTDIPLDWSDSEIPSNLKVFKYIFGLLKFLIPFRFITNKEDLITVSIISKFHKNYTYSILD